VKLGFNLPSIQPRISPRGLTRPLDSALQSVSKHGMKARRWLGCAMGL